MNRILDLFDRDKVSKLFQNKILPLYPVFNKIKRIKIIPHKNLVWTTTYHVVIEFRTTFITAEQKNKTLPIYCTAHSSEPRKNVFDSLQFLRQRHFGTGYLTVPRPLFYDEYYNGTFYRGVKGKNLYHYIKEKNSEEVEAIIPKIARWFNKLHSLSTKNARNFNQENSLIRTVFPGTAHIFDKITQTCPYYLEIYQKIYGELINKEQTFLQSTTKRWLVHGDAHPENVVKVSKNKIAMIDFTDLCLSDFARDLGSFTQQIDYMIGRKTGDTTYARKIKALFLDSYFYKTRIKPDKNLRARITNYYNWTAMRTATLFLLKNNPEEDRARPLIDLVCRNLNVR